MAKDQPRQNAMGTCGHKIVRIKRGRAFLWYCPDKCGYNTKFHHIALQPRGKAK